MTRYAELSDAAFGTEQVPACPGWTVADLTRHLGTVHRWAAATVMSGQRVDQPADVVVTEPVSEWYAAVASALLAVLQAVHPDEPTPNFSLIRERAAFWPRRQLHETTVHSVDVAQALGMDGGGWPVAPVLAADGVDEVLTVFFPRMTARGRRPDLQGRVRITATDVGRTWLLEPGSGLHAPPVLAYDAPGTPHDAEIRGTAEALYLGLWNRWPHDRLEVDGEAGAALLAGPTVP
ncbi:maleylpyruvate isomerase family mycothiol-dependent enzyme [Aeromicrobium marinum]|nr:maleylpyruvate isomerase family mycothiol-dependent enzyme [Aeromicrobium marinum]